MDTPQNPEEEAGEDALLRLYANGDRAAANELARRFTPLMFRLAQRVLGDPSEAEDVVQEAMMRLWKMAPNWRSGEAKVSTWLYRVTSNLCTDRLRKRMPVGLDRIAEPLDETPDVITSLQHRDRASALRAALAELPDRQRQAVVLRHLETLPNPEVADILGVSIEAVESLTARGKKRLSALLLHRKSELGLEP